MCVTCSDEVDDWMDGRTHRTPHDDEALLAELRKEIVDLPSYGYVAHVPW